MCDDALNGLRGFADGFFTGVLARSFLEHEIRPLEVLQEIRRVLAPGGAVIIKVPNYASINRLTRGDDWCGYRFPDHVNYFEPGHLQHLLEQAGLEIARFGLRDYFPTSDNMWCVAKCPLTPIEKPTKGCNLHLAGNGRCARSPIASKMARCLATGILQAPPAPT